MAFILGRIAQAIAVMAVMSVLVFLAVYTIGNPVDVLIDPRASQEDIEQAMRALGLDQPLWRQYLTFVQNLLQGDMGTSWVFNESALGIMLQRMPATLELALAALFLAVVIGVPLGVYAGYAPDSILAKSIMAGSILGFSLPAFWVGLMLILVFAVELGWFPVLGRGTTVNFFGVPLSLFTLDGLWHLLLPAFTLALGRIAMVIRLVRAGVRETLTLDYVKFCRARGISETRILFVHVLKNVSIPVVTVLGADFAGLLAFAVVTETVFAWPGMGKLIVDSIAMLDRPMIVAYLMTTVFLFVIINFIVDLCYGLIDPRVSIADGGGK